MNIKLQAHIYMKGNLNKFVGGSFSAVLCDISSFLISLNAIFLSTMSSPNITMLFGVITILPFLSLSLSYPNTRKHTHSHTHIQTHTFRFSLSLSFRHTFIFLSIFTPTKEQSYVIKQLLQFVAKMALPIL